MKQAYTCVYTQTGYATMSPLKLQLVCVQISFYMARLDQ